MVVEVLVSRLAINLRVNILRQVFFVRPFAIGLTFIFRTHSTSFRRLTYGFQLQWTMFDVFHLSRPTRGNNIVGDIFRNVTTIFSRRLRLAHPLLPLQRQKVGRILFHGASFITVRLNGSNSVTDIFGFATFVPSGGHAHSQHAQQTIEGYLR